MEIIGPEVFVQAVALDQIASVQYNMRRPSEARARVSACASACSCPAHMSMQGRFDRCLLQALDNALQALDIIKELEAECRNAEPAMKTE